MGVGESNKPAIDKQSVRCPGCGAVVRVGNGPVHQYLDAVPGCWELYCSLEGWKALLAEPDTATTVQWLVDGYAAQHPTNQERRNRQSVAVHLMSLCASFERGEPGARLRRAIGSWTHREYEALLPCPNAYPLTVCDVVRAEQGDRPDVVRAFAYGTWLAWAEHHERVRSWLNAITTH